MDIITMTRGIGKELQKDPRYIAYQSAQAQADGDKELQDLIGQFNLKKMDLQTEIQKEDKSQESLQAIDAQLKELYGNIMGNDNMVAYNVAKKEMDDLVNFLQQIIVYSANGEDPDSVELEAAGCSGSCSSCSGCN